MESKTTCAKLCQWAGLDSKRHRPRGGIVVVSLIFFFLFFCISILAISFPIPAVKLGAALASCTLSGTILMLLLRDIRLSKFTARSALHGNIEEEDRPRSTVPTELGEHGHNSGLDHDHHDDFVYSELVR